MKKLIALLAVGLIVSVSVARADMRVVSVSVTNGQAIKYSDPIQINGILDKVCIVNSEAGTNTITLANYTGTTALDTFVSVSAGTALTKIVRPMVLPTDNTGTALAISYGTNFVATVLSVPYQKYLIEGGLVKLAVTSGSAGSAAITNTVTATIYFIPFAR